MPKFKLRKQFNRHMIAVGHLPTYFAAAVDPISVRMPNKKTSWATKNKASSINCIKCIFLCNFMVVAVAAAKVNCTYLHQLNHLDPHHNGIILFIYKHCTHRTHKLNMSIKRVLNCSVTLLGVCVYVQFEIISISLKLHIVSVFINFVEWERFNENKYRTRRR